MDQTTLHIVYAVVAMAAILILIAIWRYWAVRVNKTADEEALERRMARLNQKQAYRRRDDEIVRLLRGDEQRILGQRNDET
jgi:ABC-type anion transport system duplicated permease subunit